MAKIKQFTIAVENRSGAVAEIAKALGKAKVNILSLLGMAQGTSGVVQLVAEHSKQARKALDKAKLSYAESTVEQIELPNKPGALAQTLEKLADKGVNLSSIHVTAFRGGKRAVVIYAVEAEAAQATTAA